MTVLVAVIGCAAAVAVIALAFYARREAEIAQFADELSNFGEDEDYT